jgi:Tol biopolymer transport system component
LAPPLQPENGFAWSRDGSHLAYFEVLDTMVRLVVERADGTHQVTIASLPIEEVLGTASTNFPVNLSWTPDGKNLILELRDKTLDPAIYLARVDGTGLVKVADSASAPTVSADGRCLAYISNDQVFLMDLTNTGLTSIWMANLPPGQQNTTRMDKLQWRP